MRRPQGYALLIDPETGIEEADTFTCGHCQKVVRVRPFADPADMGGHCKQCDALVCKHCAGGGCTPWERQMEIMEARDRARRSYGI